MGNSVGSKSTRKRHKARTELLVTPLRISFLADDYNPASLTSPQHSADGCQQHRHGEALSNEESPPLEACDIVYETLPDDDNILVESEQTEDRILLADVNTCVNFENEPSVVHDRRGREEQEDQEVYDEIPAELHPDNEPALSDDSAYSDHSSNVSFIASPTNSDEYMVEVFKNPLVRNVRAQRIVIHLSCIDEADEKRIVAESKTDPVAAMTYLLECLKQSKDPGKWQQFCEALGAEEYDVFRKLIRSEIEDVGEKHKALIRACRGYLIERIYFDEFIDTLFEIGVISNVDKDEIERREHNATSADAGSLLLDLIHTKHTNWFSLFIGTCRQHQLTDVVQLLDLQWPVDSPNSIHLESPPTPCSGVYTKTVHDSEAHMTLRKQEQNVTTNDQAISSDETRLKSCITDKAAPENDNESSFGQDNVEASKSGMIIIEKTQSDNDEDGKCANQQFGSPKRLNEQFLVQNHSEDNKKSYQQSDKRHSSQENELTLPIRKPILKIYSYEETPAPAPPKSSPPKRKETPSFTVSKEYTCNDLHLPQTTSKFIASNINYGQRNTLTLESLDNSKSGPDGTFFEKYEQYEEVARTNLHCTLEARPTELSKAAETEIKLQEKLPPRKPKREETIPGQYMPTPPPSPPMSDPPKNRHRSSFEYKMDNNDKFWINLKEAEYCLKKTRAETKQLEYRQYALEQLCNETKKQIDCKQNIQKLQREYAKLRKENDELQDYGMLSPYKQTPICKEDSIEGHSSRPMAQQKQEAKENQAKVSTQSMFGEPPEPDSGVYNIPEILQKNIEREMWLSKELKIRSKERKEQEKYCFFAPDCTDIHITSF